MKITKFMSTLAIITSLMSVQVDCEVCKSEPCKQMSRFIRSRANFHADPCTNFYEFACGNFYINGSTANVTVGQSMEDKLMTMLDEPVNKAVDSTTEVSLKRQFQSHDCRPRYADVTRTNNTTLSRSKCLDWMIMTRDTELAVMLDNRYVRPTKSKMASSMFNNIKSELIHQFATDKFSFIKSKRVKSKAIRFILDSELHLGVYNFRKQYDPKICEQPTIIINDLPAVAGQYFECPRNQVIIPMGSFVDAMLDHNRPQVLNYATLGVIVGHELAHSLATNQSFEGIFNDTCTLSKIRGLNDSAEVCKDLDEFSKRRLCFIEQYNNLDITGDGTKLNGSDVLVENLADHYGIQLAYEVYFKQMRSDDESEVEIEGLELFSERQLFWLTFATQVCRKDPKRYSDMGQHPPWLYRVNIGLRNNPKFLSDFGCELHRDESNTTLTTKTCRLT